MTPRSMPAANKTIIQMTTAKMLRRFCRITASLFIMFFIKGAFIHAQETASPDEALPDLGGTAVILHFTARVIESGREVIWNTSDSKVTISGKPVSLQLTGRNIIVVARFTPYISNDGGKFLAAQGQVWTDIPNEGVSYYTSIQTIPLEFDEPIFFFPLGSYSEDDNMRIEIQLILTPYEEAVPADDNSSNENTNSNEDSL